MWRFLLSLSLTLLSFSPIAADAICAVSSGPNTQALVELYTSEGCSSCPPADKRIAQFSDKDDAAALALHVNYWDYIGWKDHYAQAEFGQRQAELARQNRSTIYTPQFFVAGRAVPGWRAGGLAAAVRETQARASRADIQLRVEPGANPHSLALQVRAQSPMRDAPLALFVALTEGALQNQVAAGENRGVLLRHEHVVRAWIGPLRFSAGAAQLQRAIALDPSWRNEHLRLVSFVQNTASGEVLQALSSASCATLN